MNLTALVRSLENRLDRLDHFCRPDVQAIRITGGVHGSAPAASIGNRTIVAQPFEDRDAFELRALTLAREMGEPFLVLGGLRTGDGSGDG
jgi:hypothetical protein